LPSLGQPNPQLKDALKKLSATKFGQPRAQVEKDFFARMGAGDTAKKEKMDALKKAQEQRMAAFQTGNGPQVGSGITPGVASPVGAPAPFGGQPVGGGAPKPAAAPSFLDDWLAKRQQIVSAPATQPAQAPKAVPASAPAPQQFVPMPQPAQPQSQPVFQSAPQAIPVSAPSVPVVPAAPQQLRQPQRPQQAPIQKPIQKPEPAEVATPVIPTEPEKLHVHDMSANDSDDGVSIKLR